MPISRRPSSSTVQIILLSLTYNHEISLDTPGIHVDFFLFDHMNMNAYGDIGLFVERRH